MKILVLISTLLLAFAAKAETIQLTTANTVLIRGEINSESISKAQSDLVTQIKVRKKSPYPIYLVLDTPGGSIMDGIDFINYAKTLTNIKTVVIEADSMGAIITETLPFPRLIVDTGVLMFHRPQAALRGQFYDGELEARLRFLRTIVKDLSQKVADRLKISLEEYNSRVKDEYYLYGKDAVDAAAADGVVDLVCSQQLIEAEETIIQRVFIFEIETTFSKCPLFRGPKGI